MNDMQFAPSMRHTIANLAIGESFARCQRVDLELLTKDHINEELAAIRNTVSAAMRRAAEDTGNEYRVETAKFLTSNSDLMLVAVVTRRA